MVHSKVLSDAALKRVSPHYAQNIAKSLSKHQQIHFRFMM